MGWCRVRAAVDRWVLPFVRLTRCFALALLAIFRYLDAMLVSRELKAGASDFSKRVAEDDKRRLVRDAFGKLKMCVIAGGEFDPQAEKATANLPKLGPYLYTLNH